MARDYDKEIAAAEAKLQRIREAKAKAEQKRFEPVGRAMFEVFGVELSHCANVTETKEFIGKLRGVYDVYLRKQERAAVTQQPSRESQYQSNSRPDGYQGPTEG